MIELYQFHKGWGMNPSPFCLKVESYLRLAGLPYKARTIPPMKAPKGKLPFIVDEGTVVADSSTIYEYLKGKYGDRFDAGLTPAQRAEAHLIKRLLEESLYFVMTYSRWVDEEGWVGMREALFRGMPLAARLIVPFLIRRKIRRDLAGQGIGRHAREDIYKLGIADLAALAVKLEGREWLAAERMTTIDIIAHAFLFNISEPKVETPLKAFLIANPILMGHVERMNRALAQR